MSSSTFNIKTHEEAKKIWDQFHADYLSEAIKPRPVSEEVKHPSDTPLLTIQKKIAARHISKKWQQLRVSDKLFPVRVGKAHSPLFRYFVNNDKKDKPIEKSFHKRKLETLMLALKRVDWSDAIFYDRQLPNLALSLFSSAIINMQQFSSILEFVQIQAEFKVTTHRIFEKGHINKDVMNVLIPTLNQNAHLKKVETTDAIKTFLLLISQLPQSEQVFHVSDSGRFNNYNLKKLTYLGSILVATGAIYLTQDKQSLIHLSAGVRDALVITKNGLDQCVRLIPRLGELSPDDIEYAVRHKFRPAAILFPKIKPTTFVHDMNVSPWVATQHDYHHSLVATSTAIEIRKALLTMIDIVRDISHIKWSSTCWDWLDNDYRYFLNRDHRSHFYPITTSLEKPNSTSLSADFCAMLNGHDALESTRGGHLSLYTHSTKIEYLIPTGAMIFIDMINHPQKWIALKIDPEELTGAIKNHYQMIKKNFSTLESKEPILTILNCLLFFALKSTQKDYLFPLMLATIKANRDKLSIEFRKTKLAEKTEIGLYRNSISISFNGQAIARPEKIIQVVDLFCSQDKTYVAHKNIITRYNLNADETNTFLDCVKQGMTHKDSAYLSKPNFSSWFKKDLTRNILLSITVIGMPLAYCYTSTKQKGVKSALQEYSLLQAPKSRLLHPLIEKHETKIQP